ncbi:helix-turn-helix transcriptional regulator [Pseudomonas defluvii]|nr:helix-turn-helix transcriptional regulator [Pseudomonas defluvii]
MSLKSSFATVLRTLRSKRNISQRDFGDTSRTFLSKLEGGRSSLTLDKLDQISQRLELSPLTLLTLTLSLEAGKPAVELIDHLRSEIEGLERDGGLPGLEHATRGITARAPRRSQNPQGTQTLQAELCFTTSLHGGKAPLQSWP